MTIYNNDTELDTVNTDSNGHWVYTPTAPLADGSYSFTATATAGGVTSATSNSYAIAIDATAPSTPILTDVLDTEGPVQGPILDGNTTDDSRPTFNGTADSDATVLIYDNGSQIGTAPVSSGSWTFIPTSPLGDGSHSITLVAQDAVGNTSGSSAAFNFTVDTTAPNIPILTDVIDNINPVTGHISDNGFTNDNRPTFNGTADPGVTVLIYDGNTQIGSAPVPSGTWTFTPSVTLGEGPHTITLRAQNAAGNTSGSSEAFKFIVDTLAPAPPIVVSATTSTISGTAEALSTIIIKDASSNEIAHTDADGFGNWSVTLDTPLVSGDMFSVTATDALSDAAPATSGNR